MSKQTKDVIEKAAMVEAPAPAQPPPPAPPTAPGQKTTPAAGTVPAPVAEPAPLSAEELAQLQAKAVKAEEYWQRLLRQVADYENYKKRAARERQESAKYANQALLEKLIPVLDHFEMALAATNNASEVSLDLFKQGIALIHSQLKTVATEAGLEEVDATNQPFDPKWHEAVSHAESAAVPENQVLQQVRKGYKLRDRLLRPASVVVAKKPAA